MQCKNARYYYLQGNYAHGGTSVGSEGLILELVPALLTMKRGMWVRSLGHVTAMGLRLSSHWLPCRFFAVLSST